MFSGLKTKTTALMLLAVGSVGCTKADGLVLAPVNGVVELNGKPLSNAKVEFNPVTVPEKPKKGQSAAGGSFAITNHEGKYTLTFDSQRTGAVLGEHSIRITTAGRQDVPDGQLPAPEKVPPKYNLRSELKYTVVNGKNEANFQLLGPNTVTARR